MRPSSGFDKENVAPAFADSSSPESSPLKSTPTRSSQRISWSNADQHHTYSDSLKDIPSSGKAKDPARSILKRSVHIVPMESLARPSTPEPEDVISNEHYLASPVATIAESAREGSSISCSDLREAYSLLATRVRVKVHPDNVLSSFPVFKPLHEHHELLTVALERDLGRCFIDPLASPPSASTHSDATDVFGVVEIPMSSSPIREVKKRGMNDVEIRYARDLYSVCHGALRLVSNLFAIPQLCTIFDEDELNALLTALLAIPLASEIPTPNSRKTYALAIFALQTQRLPMDVVEPAKPRITYAFSRAIEGELGKEGKKGAATDALKAVAEHLHSEPAEFLDAFVDLLPSILQSILSPNVAIRTQCVHAFGAFVVARTSIDMGDRQNEKYNDTFEIISQQVGNYVDKMIEDRDDKKLADMLSKALRITLNSEAIDNKVTGPIWGACILSTIIVLSGGKLFRRPNTLKTVLTCMPYLTKHKLPLVKAIGRLVWRCFVWAFIDLQKSVDELDGPKQQSSCEAAWKIVRQVVDGSVGLAMAVAVLSDHSSRGVRRALDVVQNMFAGGSKSHSIATEILYQLTLGMTKSSARRECALNPENALLYAGLFDGNLMNFDQTTLAATLQKVVKLVEVKAIRSLTEVEVSEAWPTLCALWRVSLFQTELDDDEIPSILLSIWRGLLVSNAKDQSDDADSAMHQRVVDVFRACLSEQPDIADRQRMQISHQLWQVASEVYTSEALQHVAGAVLDELVEFDVSCADEDVLQPWAEFATAVLLASPQDTLETWLTNSQMDLDVRRQLWAELCRQWAQDEAASYEYGVLLLLSPFRAWTMSTDDWGVWDSVVLAAIPCAAIDKIPANLFLDRLSGLISHVEDDLLTLSEVVRRLISFVVVTGEGDQPIPSELFTLIAAVLEQQYPPRRVDLDCLIDLLRDIAFFIQSLSRDMILPFLEATGHGLSLWLGDEQRTFSDRQYGREMIPLYQHCLEALQNAELTLSHMGSLADLLAAPLPKLSFGADEGSSAFLRFWEHVLHVVPRVQNCCPDALVPVLKSLGERWGIDFGVSAGSGSADACEEESTDVAVDAQDGLIPDDTNPPRDVAHDSDPGDGLMSESMATPLKSVGSDIESEDDELDWVHKTPSPAPMDMEDIESDSDKAADFQPHRPSSPHTPPRSHKNSAADLAFCLDSGASTSSALLHRSNLLASDTSPLFLPSRSVLGKRQRVLNLAEGEDVRAVVRRPEEDSNEADDSIVEDSLSVELKSSSPAAHRALSYSDSSISSDASESSGGSARKRRVLDAVELPRMRSDEKNRHVHMSSLTRTFLPSKSVVRTSSQTSNPACAPPAHD